MKNIYINIMVITIALLLSACSENSESTFDTGEEKIVVTNCETYTVVQTNDLLVKDSTNTVIKIVDDINGTKTVCVVSGSAHIIREAN